MRNNTHVCVSGAAVLSGRIPGPLRCVSLAEGESIPRVEGASERCKVAHGCSLVNYSLGLIHGRPLKRPSAAVHQPPTCFPCTAHTAGPTSRPSGSREHCLAAKGLRVSRQGKAQGAQHGFMDMSCGWLKPTWPVPLFKVKSSPYNPSQSPPRQRVLMRRVPARPVGHLSKSFCTAQSEVGL